MQDENKSKCKMHIEKILTKHSYIKSKICYIISQEKP